MTCQVFHNYSSNSRSAKTKFQASIVDQEIFVWGKFVQDIFTQKKFLIAKSHENLSITKFCPTVSYAMHMFDITVENPSCTCGYHLYKDIWETAIAEVLEC